ncbi:MAG TPA: hypothetical protein VGR62_10945 [Candidatus Binatia bacterium]|jgi:hypothetical protein|nr:hypothetical protein [Candidatus Binatia bacterium]
MADVSRSDGGGALTALRETIATALDMVVNLDADSLLRRWMVTFQHIPGEERLGMVQILEREVLGRLLSRGMERPVGESTHLNPNARLYVRTLDSSFDRRAFDRDGMMIADIRAMRVATIIHAIPDIRAMFNDALREALQHVDQAIWTVAEDLLRDALACIADARAAVATDGAAAAPETSDGADPTTSDRKKRS